MWDRPKQFRAAVNTIRLGISPHLYCLPLTRYLKQGVFNLSVDSISQNAIRMRQRDLDVAFLTPIDYARESSDYRILPGMAVSSRVPNSTVILTFKEGLHGINTLAVQPTSTSEVVLASILLSERFDMRATIVPTLGSSERMMHSADAALLVGNEAVRLGSGHPHKLDLVEEWVDMTDLPYVHGFWCTREATLSKEKVLELQRACGQGVEMLEEIALEAAPSAQDSARKVQQYLESFSYSFDDQEQEALTEFLRYAYYHGALPDVADINFYPLDEEDDSQPSPSLN